MQGFVCICERVARPEAKRLTVESIVQAISTLYAPHILVLLTHSSAPSTASFIADSHLQPPRGRNRVYVCETVRSCPRDFTSKAGGFGWVRVCEMLRHIEGEQKNPVFVC